MSKEKFEKAKKHLRRITFQPGMRWCDHKNARYQREGLFKPHTAVVSCICGYSELWMR